MLHDVWLHAVLDLDPSCAKSCRNLSVSDQKNKNKKQDGVENCKYNGPRIYLWQHKLA